MSLGSGFSFQGVGGHVCGGGQFSIVDVNSARMTSCAGNSTTARRQRRADHGRRRRRLDRQPRRPERSTGTDDELYNLDPFLAQGATSIEITSSNPSDNDNLFLAVISISADAQVSTEDCDNGIDDDGDGLVDGDDPDCVIDPPPPGDFSCGEVRGDGRLSTNPDFRYVLYNVKRVARRPGSRPARSRSPT